MGDHQNEPNANALWDYFQRVIDWVERVFPTYRAKLMKGQPWGELYNKYKDTYFDKDKLEAEIAQLIQDDEVGNKKGIYLYALSREEKYLNLRAFDDKMAGATYERQKGICPACGKNFEIKDMEADHIVPWSKGGKTNQEN